MFESMQAFTEIKHHKNKPTQTFICKLLHKEKEHVVLKYYSEKEGHISNIKIPSGTTTIAYYWSNRNYVIWKMYDRNEKLIGTLFHICKDVKITETSVSYLDLILDIWISTNNSVKILDEDELEEAKQNGLLTESEIILIEKSKNKVLSDYRSLAAQII